MVSFLEVWHVLNARVPPLKRSRVILDELLVSLALLPLLCIDFRTLTSSLVTCSDASDSKIAGCVSRVPAEVARELLRHKSRKGQYTRPMGSLWPPLRHMGISEMLVTLRKG